MDQLMEWMEYLRDEPRVAIALGLGALAFYFLMQRKSRLQKDAEHRLASLRREKDGRYNSLRPPQ
jgi:hypothetical protein